VDFLFHVEDPYIWRSGSDFYERPPDTEVHYILLTENNDARFVGIQLAEFRGSEGKNLAGMYIAHSGTRLGEIQLLKAAISSNASSLIGPTAAVSAFQTNSDVREKLTLFGGNYKLGNILLYMINQRLYYFIPVYITPSGAGGVITKMPFIGVVDALTREVAIGGDSAAAYSTLTKQVPGGQPDEAQRISDVYAAFGGRGYVPLNVTAVYPDVFVQKDNVSYLNPQDKPIVDSRIASFINNYVKVYGGEVYSWMPQPDTINFGVFNITPRGIKEFYCMSIEIR